MADDAQTHSTERRSAPHYQPPQAPLDVLFADDAVVAFDKPSGLLSVPGRGPDRRDSLATRAADAFGEIHVVHRLDMDTSGVVVMARSLDALRDLSRQFEQRLTQKTYVACAWGSPAHESGVIDAPMGPDWPNRPLQKIDHVRGKPARTHWRVLSREHDSCRLELIPVTGRSHQIRVHLASMGHPILGDVFYAPPAARDAAPRLLLHAQRLEIAHPATGSALCLRTPCPF